MPHNTVNRCIWLIDTIRRYGRITRTELDRCWMRSTLSDGQPMPRRTFANYRQRAQEMFKTEIKCDPSTFEYYIDDDAATASERGGGSVTEWLLNSAVTNEALARSRDIADRIFVEEVPSAREYLAPVIAAVREHHPIRFNYHSYTRSTPTPGVVLEPYFLKLFRQRWYVTGLNRADRRIKTYALDRMTALHLIADTFTPNPAFDPREYSRNSFGIISGRGEPAHIILRADPLQAKYLRALPLHHSQQEYVHDEMSLFHYRMYITTDLVDEIMALTPRVTVVQPRELREQVRRRLEAALAAYKG
ncbi:MAG: WYL domain-containing protein [Muribaculaceae bacterium]|nr:WYL domain-containing protein [Muribaculaceae bacterium]